jgi:hypothetical protein
MSTSQGIEIVLEGLISITRAAVAGNSRTDPEGRELLFLQLIDLHLRTMESVVNRLRIEQENENAAADPDTPRITH